MLSALCYFARTHQMPNLMSFPTSPGKNKETLEMLPMLIGFFTYQAAVLAQGIKAMAADKT